MRNVKLAVNICTYHRKFYIERNISKLLDSKFFKENEREYYGRLHIYVVDNAAELKTYEGEFLHVVYNRNTGGSGGFQRGIEEIRRSACEYSHVIFMDDDVDFELETFYILFEFLRRVDEEHIDNPIAGRMFCMDRRDVQYTAAEVWNGGNLKHIEYMRKITAENYIPGKVIYDSGAEYGGWWFCCFPMEFVSDNDVLPFFIHCDDVEYGLRCAKSPIIIEGVQVWHETFDKRQTPIMKYYDIRNPLFVNQIYRLFGEPSSVLKAWKENIAIYHVRADYITEYYIIRAMGDFLKGLDWLKGLDSEKYHKKLIKMRGNKIKNAIAWRLVERKFKRKYEL